MAEEKKIPEKQGWFKKLINWFVNLPGRIAKAFKNMFAELNKVTWPSKKKWISSCIVVLLFILITGVIVSVLDWGSAAAVNGLYRLGHPVQEYYTEEDITNIPGEELTDGTETTEGATVEDPTVEDPAVEEPAVEEPTVEENATTEENTEPAAE